MKKLTAGIFATLLAVVSVGAAHAEIASKGYVDQQVGTKADASTVTSLQGTVSTHTSQIGTINDTIGGYGDIVSHSVSEFATSAQGAKADTAVQPDDITNVERTTNKTQTVNAQSTEAQYPSAKAVWTAVSSVDASVSVEALKGRVDTLETASKTHATKTEVTEGLAEKLDTATAAATYATKTELAGKQNTIAGAQLEALNSGITADKVEAYDGYAAQISGKLDTATADGKYAIKSTETTASTASTKADTALKNIGTLTELTTEAKTNTVAAINEVAKEAADAATAAAGARTAADTAQGDVDALETVVNNETTGLAAAHTAIDAVEGRVTTAEGEIDDIQGQISNMATNATVSSLTTRVTAAEGDIDNLEAAVNNAESGLAATNTIADNALSTAQSAKTTADAALPKATYDSQVGTVSATNMGTTASTVVTAINEVAGEAAAAQKTANAAIPAPTAACADPDNKCVLVSAGAGNYSWEVIARGGAE